jgi:transcriptional regulator with PAS, ATPase and Fis domain
MIRIASSIASLDEGGAILLLNDKAAALLSTDSETVIGEPLANFVQSDRIIQQIEEITAAPLEMGANWTFEARSERLKTDYLVSVSIWGNPARASRVMW